MDHERQGGSRRPRWLWLLAGVSAATVALGMSVAASAESGNDDDQGLAPAPPPANSQCQGPGCGGTGEPVQSLLLLAGTGTGCADGGACFWVNSDFQGDKSRVDDVDCCDWFFVQDIDHFRSAKNRYLVRKVQTGNAQDVTSCMDPGENRPNLDFSDRIRVGAIGSHC